MYLSKTPRLIQYLFKGFTWRKQVSDKVIYLTFDDGPIPEVTEWVLDILQEYKAKATFFCVGDNINKHPQVFEKVILNGHKVANHTYNHLQGLSSKNDIYFSNINRCQQSVKEYNVGKESGKPLFRPPHGRLKFSQASFLREHYEIVMWDVLSGDFDPKLKPQLCLKRCIRATKEGSIIVFHDSVKTYEKLKHVLPAYIQYFTSQGFRFETL